MTLRGFAFICLLCAFFLPVTGRAQCPALSFDSPAAVCLNETINIRNTSPDDGSGTSWDFCAGDLAQDPTGLSVRQVLDAVGPAGISLVTEGQNYFVFMTGRNSNNLVRLDLGNDPKNPNPATINLGNLAGVLKSPIGLSFIQEDGSWYAITYNSQSDSLVRISFGSLLSNPNPVAEQIVRAYGSNNVNSGLAVGVSSERIVAAVTSPVTNKVTLIDFGNTITNNPTDPANVLSTSSIPGAGALRGITLNQICGEWYGFAAASSSRKLFRLDFGEDLFSQPDAVDITSGFSGTENFQDVRVLHDGGDYVGFLLTSQGIVYRADFGATITSVPEITSMGNLGVIAGTVRFDFIKSNSSWSFFTANTGTRFLYRGDFPNDCSVSRETDFDFQPGQNAYASPGVYKLMLQVRNPASGYSYLTKEIEVEDKPAPQIEFNYAGACAGNETDFMLTSDSDLLNVSWDFGDGDISSVPNPSHVFLSGTDYAVSVEATSINGCENTRSQLVNIYDPPEADFDLPPDLLCTRNEFMFSSVTPDIYDGNLSYHWFVDNIEVGTERDLRYIFSTTGTKEIKLQTSIPGCSDEITKITPAIETGPAVDFSFTGICEDESFSFQSEITDPIENHLWDFGNGETSTDLNPELLFLQAGEYSVSLSATNTIGCETVVTKAVTVRSTPMVDFVFEGAGNGCSGSETYFENATVNMDDSPIAEWLWEFGDPNNTSTGTGITGQHSYNEAGDYHVSLTATTADGCTGNVEKPITIRLSPSTAYSHSPACEDVPVLFTAPPDEGIEFIYWEVGTSYYIEDSPAHTFLAPGDYPFYLEVTGANGCVATVGETIRVPIPLVPDFSVVRNCVGEEAVFTDVTTGVDAIVTRQWQFDTSETFTGSPVTHTFGEQGSADVRLTVTAESGCSYAITRAVEIVAAPVANFTADPALGAYPLEVSFTNTSAGATESHWKINDGEETTSDEFSPVHTFQGPGAFDVQLTVSNAQGCEDTFSGTVVTVDPLPDVDVEMINLVDNPDGTARLIVTIHNKGNTILNALALDIDFDGVLQLRQILPEPVLPSAKYNFILNTSIVNISSLGYLCVFADLRDDLSPDGNLKCEEFKDRLVIIPAFPNPSAGTINIKWIAVAAGQIQISLVDGFGRRIFYRATDSTAGLNYHTVDLSHVESGLYFLVMDDGASKNTQRIVLHHTP